MLRKSLRFSLVSLLVLLPLAASQAQQGAVGNPQQPRAGSAAQMPIPDLVALATQYRAERRINEAVGVLQNVLQRDETNIDAMRMMGDIAWDAGNAEEAKKYWRSVREIQPSDFGANFGLGRIHLSVNSYRSAVSYLETAAKVVPADPPELEPRTWVLLTQAHRGAGDLDPALAASEQAVRVAEASVKSHSPTPKLDTARFEAWYAYVAVRTELANRVRRQEDYDRALGSAERLIQIAGEQLEANGTTREGVERVHSAYGLELQVLYAYRAILFERNANGRLSDRLLPGMSPLAAAITGKTVDVMLRQTDLERTITHFQVLQLAEMAVNFDGAANPKFLMDLGTLQVSTGQLEAAAATFQRVLEIDPTNETARQQLEALPVRIPAPPSDEPSAAVP